MANTTTLVNVGIPFLVIIFRLLGWYTELSFAVSLAIILPISAAYVTRIVNHITQDNVPDDVEERMKKTSVILAIFSVFYVIGMAGVIVWHALSPIEITVFISILGALELASGVYMTKLFEYIFEDSK